MIQGVIQQIFLFLYLSIYFLDFMPCFVLITTTNWYQGYPSCGISELVEIKMAQKHYHSQECHHQYMMVRRTNHELQEWLPVLKRWIFGRLYKKTMNYKSFNNLKIIDAQLKNNREEDKEYRGYSLSLFFNLKKLIC